MQSDAGRTHSRSSPSREDRGQGRPGCRGVDARGRHRVRTSVECRERDPLGLGIVAVTVATALVALAVALVEWLGLGRIRSDLREGRKRFWASPDGPRAPRC